MDKPLKPTKKVVRAGSLTFYFDHISNRVSLEYFNQWIKDNLPKGAYDVFLAMDEDYDYYSGDIIAVYLKVEYLLCVKNTKYTSQMKKYQEQLVKWKKQNKERKK